MVKNRFIRAAKKIFFFDDDETRDPLNAIEFFLAVMIEYFRVIALVLTIVWEIGIVLRLGVGDLPNVSGLASEFAFFVLGIPLICAACASGCLTWMTYIQYPERRERLAHFPIDEESTRRKLT